MYATLFFKEWKDKLGLWAFGAGLLVLAFAMSAALPGPDKHLDVVAGVILVLYFPAMALLLGSSAFEAEFRNDAWAYLLSRPVSKAGVWAVKFAALLSLLAALWLVFAAALAVVPGLRAVVAGLRLQADFRAEIGFLPWSLLLSLYFFTAGFSMSFLSRKGSTVLFVSLLAGLALAFVAYREAGVVLGVLRDEWIDEGKWLHAFRWGFVFMGAALAAASFLTFGRADFSQPKKKAAVFVKFAAPLVVAAMLVTAAWTVLLPRTGDKYISFYHSVNGGAYINAYPDGLFAYDPSRDSMRKIAGSSFINLYWHPLPFNPGRKILFSKIVRLNARDAALNLWIMDADGTGERQLLGAGLPPADPGLRLSAISYVLSRDAKRVALFDEDSLYGLAKGRSPLWTMNADGSGLRNEPMDPAVFKNWKEYRLFISQWTESGDGILIYQWSGSSAKPSRLWLADLKNGNFRILLESFVLGWSLTPSPDGRFLAVPMKTMDGPIPHLAVAIIDLASLEIRKIDVPGERSIERVRWSPDGGQLAFFIRRESPKESGSYVLTVVSATDGKTLASLEKTDEESTGRLYDIEWLNENNRLVFSDPRGERCLKILGPDLREEKKIAFPDTPSDAQTPFDIMTAGDKVLALDLIARQVWRLDLKTEHWKKIY